MAFPSIKIVTDDNIINAQEKAAGVTVSGTTDPGLVVTVTWGSLSRQVTADPSGQWSLLYTSDQIPADGNSRIVARVLDPTTGTFASGFIRVTVDTQINAPTIDPVATDNVVDATEKAAGINVTGTAEPGSKVTVTWGNVTKIAYASSSGKWSTTYASNEVPADAANAPVTANAVDVAGNVSDSTTRDVQIQAAGPATLPLAPTIDPVAGDDVVNAAEKSGGIAVTGTAEPGTRITVNWGSVIKEVITNGNGQWQANYKANEVPPDGGSTQLTATATDKAGNTSNPTTHTIEVDTATVAPTVNAVAVDNVVNASEKAAGVAITGTAEPGSQITVTWGNTTKTVLTDTNGKWNATYVPNEVPADAASTTVSVSAKDTAGNVSSVVTTNVKIDTATVAPTIQPVATDNVVNATEKASGVVINGTAEPNSQVTVSWGNTTKTVDADSNGNWRATYAPGDIPPDAANAPVSVTAKDTAGNVSTKVSTSVKIDTATVAPTLNPVASDNTVNATEKAAGVAISGTAEPNSQVTVTWGNTTKTVPADANGLWSATYGPSEVPADATGTTVSVTAKDSAGNTSAVVTTTVRVDTAIAAPTLNAVATDNVVNALEKASGVTLNGSAEANSTVSVTWGSVTKSVPVDANGLWRVDYASTEVPADAANAPVSVTATDSAGNTSNVVTTNVRIDTTTAAPTLNPVATDNIVNAAEKAAGVTLSGTAEPNAQITLTWGNVTKTVPVGTNGRWSTTYSPSEVPADAANVPVSVIAQDSAGNTSAVITTNVRIDTATAAPTINPIATDNIINSTEKAAGISVSGTAEPSSQVTVTWGNVTKVVSTDTIGQWTASFAPNEVPADAASTTVSVSAQDVAGNVSSVVTASVRVDTATAAPTVNAVATDNIVNAAEKAAGVSISGTAEPNSKVTVAWGNVTKTVSTDAKGQWTASYAPSEVPADAASVPVSVTAKDTAGNTSGVVTANVRIDTATAAPTINAIATDNIVNAAEKAAGVPITGTAEPDSQVTITWGNVTKTVSTDAKGQWTASYAPSEVPADAASTTVSVSAKDTAGNTSSVVTANVRVDASTQAPTLNAIATDNVVNAAEKAAGISVSGTAEPNSKVTVVWGNTTKTVDANASGSWSATYSASEVPADATSTTVSVSAKDTAGNTSSVVTANVRVDTVTAAPTVNAIATDNIVNSTEKAAGVSISGTAEANSKVTVVWGNTTKTVDADASGNWSATYGPSEVPADAASTTVSVSAKDTAGNTSGVVTANVRVDTAAAAPTINAIANDNIVDGSEKAAGVAISGTAEANSQVTITWGQTTKTVPADANGKWSTVYTAAEVPADAASTTVSVSAKDTAGNASSVVTANVRVDATSQAPTINAIATDNVVNAAEKAAGITVSGTAEPNSKVTVVWGNTTKTVDANASGNWSATYSTSEVPTDAANVPVSVSAKDDVGNVSSTITANVMVDTAIAPPTLNAVATDNIVNATEKAAGVAISGTAEANSKVTVVWGNISKTVSTDANGQWSATYSASEVPADAASTTVSVSAKDTAGNASSTVTASVKIDTAITAPTINTIATDNIVNAAEKAAGISFSGTAEPSSQVTVTWGNVSKIVSADIKGLWSASYASDEAPADAASSAVSVSAKDIAGNVSSTVTSNVKIDTVIASPTLNAVATDNIVNATEKAAGINLSGTAEPGSKVSVNWGSITKLVSADASGKWSATYSTSEVPADAANVPVNVSAKDDAGNVSSTITANVMVDTTIAPPTLNAVATDNIVNAAEKAAGVAISGTAEANSKVTVVWGNISKTVPTGANGQWSATYSASEVPADAASTTVSVSAKDTAGNASSTVTASVKIDTAITAPTINAIAADNVVNAAEKAAGVTVSGTADPSSQVTITWGNTTKNVLSDASGKWSTSYKATEVPADAANAPVSVTAKDDAGNVSGTVTAKVTVDTVATTPTINAVAGDNIVNAAEKAAGVSVTGTAEANSQVTVTWGSVTQTVAADAKGQWTAAFNASQIPGDSADVPILVTATDAAGNTSDPAKTTVKIDTTIVAPTINTVAGDNVVNAAEKAAGVTLSGTAEAKSEVTITWGGISKTVTADANGQWSALYHLASTTGSLNAAASGPSEVPADAANAPVTVTAKDAAGNMSAKVTANVTIDTVSQTPTIDPVAGDNIVNAAEKSAGVTLSGTAEPNSKVSVSWGGITKTVTADATGKWSALYAKTTISTTGPVVEPPVSEVSVPPARGNEPVLRLVPTPVSGGSANPQKPATETSEVPADAENVPVVVFAVDVLGNVSPTVTAKVKIDTVIAAPTLNAVAGDDMVNAAEKAAGVNVSGSAEANSQVTITWGKTTKTVLADATGAWKTTYASGEVPADSTKTTVSVSAKDAAGNLSSTVTSNVVVDTMIDPPTVRLARDTGANAADRITRDAAIQVGTTESGNYQLAYQVDNGAWTNGYTAPSNDGVHTVSVRLTDRAGNSSVSSTSFTLDTSTPAPKVQLSSDTGSSASDRITANPAITALATESNATLQYQVDGGAWSNTYTAPNRDGLHQVNVRQEDVAGNVTIQALTFTLDTQAKAPTIELAVDSGVSNSDRITNQYGVKLGNIEDGATVLYQFDYSEFWTDKYRDWFTDGTHTVKVKQIDLAGNTSPVSSLTFELDRKATDLTAPVIQLNQDTGRYNNDRVTSVHLITIFDPAAYPFYEIKVDDGSWSDSMPNSLPDGKHTYYARKIDVAGNPGPVSSLTFTLDTTAPKRPIAYLSQDSYGNIMADDQLRDRITSNARVNIVDLEWGNSWMYSLNNGLTWIPGVADGGAWVPGVSDFIPASAFGADGYKSVLVKQIDLAGNMSSTLNLDKIADGKNYSYQLPDTASDGVRLVDGNWEPGLFLPKSAKAVGQDYYVVNSATAPTSIQTVGTSMSSPVNLTHGDSAHFTWSGSGWNYVWPGKAPAILDFQLDTFAAAPKLYQWNGAVRVDGLEPGAGWQYQVDGGNWQTGTGTSFGMTLGNHTYSVKQIDMAGNVSTSTVLTGGYYLASLGNPKIDGISSTSWNDIRWHYYNSYYEPAANSVEADLRIALGSGVKLNDVIKIFGDQESKYLNSAVWRPNPNFENPTYSSLEYRDGFGLPFRRGNEDTVHKITQDDLNCGFVDLRQSIRGGDLGYNNFFKAALFDSTGTVQLSDYSHEYKIFKL